MKSFQDNSFNNAFQRIMAKAKPTPTATRWEISGTVWVRDRHSYTGQDYMVHTEVFRLTHRGAPAWELMIVFENWWHASSETPVRNAHWAKLIKGRKQNVLPWFRKQEALVNTAPT